MLKEAMFKVGDVTETRMTLRDRFAVAAPDFHDVIMAMVEMKGGALSDDRMRSMYMDLIAVLQYEYADAMLKARDRKP